MYFSTTKAWLYIMVVIVYAVYVLFNFVGVLALKARHESRITFCKLVA